MDPKLRLKEVAAGWRPPAELDRSRPRDVRLKRAGRVVAVLALLLLTGALVSGVLLYVKSTSDHETRRQITESGQDTQGRVVRRFQTRSDNKQRFWLVYEYQTGERTYGGRLRVGHPTWLQLEAGAPLTVRYLASDPALHIVVGHAGGLMPLWVPYLVAGGFALGAWLVIRVLLRQRFLLAEGRPAPAIVTRHQKDKHGAIVHFVFQRLSGATAEGKTGPRKKPPALGSVLCVLYLPDRPKRHAAYPLALVRTARETTNWAGRHMHAE